MIVLPNATHLEVDRQAGTLLTLLTVDQTFFIRTISTWDDSYSLLLTWVFLS